MTIELIAQMIVGILPSVIAVIGVVTLVYKQLKEFKITRAEVRDLKVIDDLKAEIKSLAADNRDLKKQIKELLTAITKISRE